MCSQESGNWLKRHFWIILVDALGAGLLITLLMAANGAPALKPALLALLSLVPLTGLYVMLTSRQRQPQLKPAPIAVSHRTIFIAPRPTDQRT